MTIDELQSLVNIYNNLLTIHTKGNDSFVLVDNLRELYKIIMKQDEKIKEENNGDTK